MSKIKFDYNLGFKFATFTQILPLISKNENDKIYVTYNDWVPGCLEWIDFEFDGESVN
jgi:hypothetical protein